MKIEIEIPENTKIMSEIAGFSVNDNEMMLEMGSFFVKSLKERCESSEMKEYKEECKAEIEEQYRQMYKDQLYEMSVTNKVAKDVYDGLLIEQTQREVQRIKHIEEEKYRHMESLNQRMIQEMSRKMDILEKQFRECEKENVVLKEKEKNVIAMSEMSIQQQISERIQKKDERIGLLEESIRGLKIEEERKIHKMTVENSEIMSKTLIDLNQKMESIQQSEFIASKRGKEGESCLYELLEQVFYEMDDEIEIVNTSKQSHMGDFHLKFRDFTILVDSKNFVNSSGVSSTDRKKMKYDMNHNKHIKIAWMVSLYKPIHCYSKAPFMIDIDNGVCYCYVNSLMNQENPGNILRTLYYCCKIVYDFALDTIDDAGDSMENTRMHELTAYKENEERLKRVMGEMNKLSKERFQMIQRMMENFEMQDKYNLEIMTKDVVSLQDMRSNAIHEWFDKKVESREGGVLKTDNMYDVFCRENEGYSQRITKDMFRSTVCSFIDSSLIVKGKTAKTQYTIRNHVYRV
jgi:hypothetical protein